MLDGRDEVLICRHKNCDVVCSFPCKSDQVGDDASVDRFLGSASKPCAAVWTLFMLSVTRATMDGAFSPMSLGREDANARLSIKKSVEPILELVFASRFVPSIDTGLFKSERSKASGPKRARSFGAKDGRKLGPVTLCPVAPFGPRKLEVPEVYEYADAHYPPQINAGSRKAPRDRHTRQPKLTRDRHGGKLARQVHYVKRGCYDAIAFAHAADDATRVSRMVGYR